MAWHIQIPTTTTYTHTITGITGQHICPDCGYQTNFLIRTVHAKQKAFDSISLGSFGAGSYIECPICRKTHRIKKREYKIIKSGVSEIDSKAVAESEECTECVEKVLHRPSEQEKHPDYSIDNVLPGESVGDALNRVTKGKYQRGKRFALISIAITLISAMCAYTFSVIDQPEPEVQYQPYTAQIGSNQNVCAEMQFLLPVVEEREYNSKTHEYVGSATYYCIMITSDGEWGIASLTEEQYLEEFTTLIQASSNFEFSSLPVTLYGKTVHLDDSVQERLAYELVEAGLLSTEEREEIPSFCLRGSTEYGRIAVMQESDIASRFTGLTVLAGFVAIIACYVQNARFGDLKRRAKKLVSSQKST